MIVDLAKQGVRQFAHLAFDIHDVLVQNNGRDVSYDQQFVDASGDLDGNLIEGNVLRHLRDTIVVQVLNHGFLGACSRTLDASSIEVGLRARNV